MSWLKHLSAQVVRIMLDYTDQVSFCTKLKETLMEQKQWPEICHIQSENTISHVDNRSVLITLCALTVVVLQETHVA